MSFQLTDNAEDKTTDTKKEPCIVVEIDGYDRVFSITSIQKIIRVGDVGLYVDGNWVLGGSNEKQDVDQYITLGGTTTSISQQLQQDKGGTSSVTSMQISLADFHGEISELVSPGFVLDDILGREAFVYLGFKDTLFPEDFITLFVGIIDEVTCGANIVLNISNPEQKKRQDIFANIETELDGAIDDSQTTITLASTANLFEPVSGSLETYIKIDDEIIKYTGISGNDLTGCTRAQFDTIAAAHDDEASASSFLRLMGGGIELALQLMLSGPDEYYKTEIQVSNFVRSASGTDTANSVVFVGVDAVTKYGLTVGDFITTTGASNGANNFNLGEITSIEVNADGTIVIVDGPTLVLEVGTSATASFKSKYNILPDGLGLGGHQVDVDEFDRIQTLFGSDIHDYDFYLTDTIKGKEFIDKEIMFPANLFTLPKKGRISLGVVSPPLNVGTVAVLDADTITRPDSIKIKRSTEKYFYNTVIYKYNFDAVETDKPLTGYIRVDEDSKNQIKRGTKAITIISKGMRNNATTASIVDINSRRLLEKYKFAAEEITVSGFFGTLFNSDVGDVVLFGDSSMPIVDTKAGQRGFTPRLCEIINKKMDLKTGRVDVTLLDTSYLTDGRYGIISPSSTLDAGSTTTELVITDSFSTVSPDIEKNKWLPYVGEKIFIHSDDWSVSYDSTLIGFDPSDPYTMRILPIGGAPPAGYVVDIANYPEGAIASDNRNLKNTFVFTDPSVAVLTGTSDFVFDISISEVDKFFVGSQIMLHNVDWSDYSENVRVVDISTTTITVDKSLGFTPDNTYTVELIGFQDRGSAYRFL